jgi:hypothetical protein
MFQWWKNFDWRFVTVVSIIPLRNDVLPLSPAVPPASVRRFCCEGIMRKNLSKNFILRYSIAPVNLNSPDFVKYQGVRLAKEFDKHQLAALLAVLQMVLKVL